MSAFDPFLPLSGDKNAEMFLNPSTSTSANSQQAFGTCALPVFPNDRTVCGTQNFHARVMQSEFQNGQESSRRDRVAPS
jgi:hypothetical protein